MSTERAKARARAGISALAALGSKVTTYVGGDGAVSTVGYIDKQSALFGGDVTAADARFVLSLLFEDVGTPQRGDRVTDEDGVEWALLEEVPGDDPWVTDWTVQRR